MAYTIDINKAGEFRAIVVIPRPSHKHADHGQRHKEQVDAQVGRAGLDDALHEQHHVAPLFQPEERGNFVAA